MATTLRADVWVSSRLPLAITRLNQESSFSPVTCTLIQGETGTVLVDTPISVSQTEDLIDWIITTSSGKQVTFVYITHGHGDHWFEIPLILRRWPNATVLATAATIEHMKEQLKPTQFEGLWTKLFPNGQIAEQTSTIETVKTLDASGLFQLEGHEFHAIEVGHTDTRDTTILHVPTLRLVVAGDVVYGDVHQFFGEATTAEKRREWLKALETVEKLEPHLVVAGHKRPGTCDGVFNVHSTREYILFFEEALSNSSDWEALYQQIVDRYHTRINPHAALAGALAAFAPRHTM